MNEDHALPLSEILSPQKGAELSRAIEAATSDDLMISIWDESTGFCVQVYLVGRLPVRWWMTGPLTAEQAAEHLQPPANRNQEPVH